jgi:hypothetical protein
LTYCFIDKNGNKFEKTMTVKEMEACRVDTEAGTFSIDKKIVYMDYSSQYKRQHIGNEIWDRYKSYSLGVHTSQMKEREKAWREAGIEFTWDKECLAKGQAVPKLDKQNRKKAMKFEGVVDKDGYSDYGL